MNLPLHFTHPVHSRRLHHFVTADDGMSTVEYAVGTIAAAGFALVLYHVVTGDNVFKALTTIIDNALALKL